MTKSALQIARAAYQPKLPKALTGAVVAKEGEPTQSVADQDERRRNLVWWTGSWWPQRNLRFVRRYQETEPG